jgi:magnesium transporter
MAEEPEAPDSAGTNSVASVTETANANLDRFRRSVMERNFELAERIAAALSPAELRNAFLSLTPEQTVAFYQSIGNERFAYLIEGLEVEDAAEVLSRLSNAEAADVLDELAPDDAADVIDAIKAEAPERAQAILMEMKRAVDVQALLAYPPDTAGGRMTTEFLAVRPETTAEETMNALREWAREGKFCSYVYVTDHGNRLVGVVPLYRLVLSDPTTKIGDVMVHSPVRVRATDDQQEVARIFRERRFMAVPVVDLEDRLIGVVTADDIADVIEQEATEDMYRMAGVGVKERATSPVLESARRRVPWLAFNMAWSLCAALVVSHFQRTIEMAPVLAVFMPVITGQAGNAGIQTATIVIRSLALGDVTPRDTMTVLLREMGVGVIKGVIFGVALALIAWIWKDNLMLGVVAGLSLFLNIAIVASMSGVLLPMTLSRLGIDPATIAGVFDTMLSDFVGNFIYLGLATLFIYWLV